MKNIIESLKWRYAVKKFDPNKKISEEKISQIKEALKLTPSSFGIQPWKFLFVKNQKTREKLREHSWNQGQIVDASHLIVLCNQDKIDEDYVENWVKLMSEKGTRSLENLQGYKETVINNVVNPNSYRGKNQKTYMQNQVFIALGNLMTVAASLGIDTCPIGGFDSNKYDEILNLKEKGIQSCVVCPIGYRSAEDDHQNDPKIRFSNEDLFEEI